jgi:hypothetical protein
MQVLAYEYERTCIIFVKSLTCHKQQKNVYVKVGKASGFEFQLEMSQNAFCNVKTLLYV